LVFVHWMMAFARGRRLFGQTAGCSLVNTTIGTIHAGVEHD
jgi:hypothetical protein